MNASAGTELLNRFVEVIIDPAMYLIFTAGFLVFIYGLVEFLYKLKDGGDHREGVNHMIWGMAGMLIMVSVLGIISLISNTFGLDFGNPDMSRAQNVQPGANFFGQ